MNATETRRTRRGILKGGAAAVALAGVTAAMRGRAEAASGDPILMGKVNNAGKDPTTVNADVERSRQHTIGQTPPTNETICRTQPER